MFIIKSYIKYPNIPVYDLEDVEKRPFHYFIDINNSEEILRIKKDLDLDYIDGVLHLTYNNQVIISFRSYDLIDHLWAYFLNMVEEFLQKKRSEMSFPDQPTPISMNYISDDYILFSINFTQWTLPKYEFFNALLLGAKDFFEKIMLLIEEEKDSCMFQLRKIKNLEKQVNALKK
ncbi:MAG TPA: hypothetical protein VJJ26_03165 [Candidatus Babeliales bacterium]|nr:hypothetical protein [Candidatus Babeliales bacterium]